MRGAMGGGAQRRGTGRGHTARGRVLVFDFGLLSAHVSVVLTVAMLCSQQVTNVTSSSPHDGLVRCILLFLLSKLLY